MTNPSSGNPIVQFCALAYLGQQSEVSPSPERIVVILIKDSDGMPHLFVRPNWVGVVEPIDRDYIQEVLDDFQSRLEFDFEALLRQMSQLSVGPLVTYAAGTQVSEYPALLNLIGQFERVNFR